MVQIDLTSLLSLLPERNVGKVGEMMGEGEQTQVGDALIDGNVAALFLSIVTDLWAARRSSRLHLKLNSSGCDVLIGTLFPLIEQIRKKSAGGELISGREDSEFTI